MDNVDTNEKLCCTIYLPKIQREPGQPTLNYMKQVYIRDLFINESIFYNFPLFSDLLFYVVVDAVC